MTDRTLLPAAFGGIAPADDVAVVPGWGPVAGREARAWVRDALDTRAGTPTSTPPRRPDWRPAAFVWLRRLFTDPTGRDLVALDSGRRRFHGGLRRFLELRDPTCRVPWCDAPAVQTDHVTALATDGSTAAANGAGVCQRHNLVKELDGWHVPRRRPGSTGAEHTASASRHRPEGPRRHGAAGPGRGLVAATTRRHPRRPRRPRRPLPRRLPPRRAAAPPTTTRGAAATLDFPPEDWFVTDDWVTVA